MYLASQEELKEFVDRNKHTTLLAIDTEFLREKTYYPKLCLLQMATDTESAIVDPFTCDLLALRPLLEDENIVKIFHSGHQDIEILLYRLDCIPKPIFDTQVAAALLGQTSQIGYATLVRQLCGVKLKKLDSFTDWSNRPLSSSQLDYALDDVQYLPQLYHEELKLLKEKNRLDWLEAELEAVYDRSQYISDEREMFRHLKHAGQLSNRQQAAAREIAAWREIEARKRNLPRRWVLTDEQVVELCRREPQTIDDLFMVRGVRERLTTADARSLMKLVRSALDSAPETWPEENVVRKTERTVDVQVDMLMAIVRMKAKEYDIASATLANHADLTSLARGHRKENPLLTGWRGKILGKDLLDFLEGRTVLRITDNKPDIQRQDQ